MILILTHRILLHKTPVNSIYIYIYTVLLHPALLCKMNTPLADNTESGCRLPYGGELIDCILPTLVQLLSE